MNKLTKLQELSFDIIGQVGDAKNSAYEALAAAKANDRELFENKIEEAERYINGAHKIQFELIQAESRGELEDDRFSIIAVHGQDHLMTVMSLIEVFKELGEMYLTFNNR